jgi:ornithine carbamoyltransferase
LALFNLRNRSFLKEIDFELRFLLQLSEALKVAKYAGTEVEPAGLLRIPVGA